jgi:hypothetical protein
MNNQELEIKDGVYMFINSELFVLENGICSYPEHLWFWFEFDIEKFFRASIYLGEL